MSAARFLRLSSLEAERKGSSASKLSGRMGGWLLVMAFLFLGLAPSVAHAEFQYLHLEVYAASNALLTEGFFARNSIGTPAPAANLTGTPSVIDPPPITTLFGSLEMNVAQDFAGRQLQLTPEMAGDFLLTAAKDSTYSAQVKLALMEDEVVAAHSVNVLVNSRERISYDLFGDAFSYGTKVISFPRDQGEFHITFQYGGWFTYYDPQHFEIFSASGVRMLAEIRTIPEPTTGGLLLWAAGSLLGKRWRRHSNSSNKVCRGSCEYAPAG